VKKSVLIPVAVALAGAAASVAWFWRSNHEPPTLRLPGNVEIQDVRLGSKVGGRVQEVLIREGDLVQAGQELVRFEVPELSAQREQVKQKLAAAEAEWAKAEAGPRPQEIAEARAATDAAGARLKKMQAGFREEEKKQAADELASAEADLRYTQDELTRAEQVRSPAVTESELTRWRSERDRNQGRVAAAKAKLELMRNGYRPEEKAEAVAEFARAQARYDLLVAGTRAEDKAVAAAQVAELRGKLAEVEANLAEGVVRAPERAVVEVLAVRKGDVVPPNQPVLRVLRADDLWVKVFVPSTELGKVRLNQPAEVTCDAYPDRHFRGVVTQVGTISEFTPRNVQSVDERKHQVFAVKVRVDDPQGVFKSGMAAEVVLPLAEAPR
jgi:multidrug resistance efflux pump